MVGSVGGMPAGTAVRALRSSSALPGVPCATGLRIRARPLTAGHAAVGAVLAAVGLGLISMISASGLRLVGGVAGVMLMVVGVLGMACGRGGLRRSGLGERRGRYPHSGSKQNDFHLEAPGI